MPDPAARSKFPLSFDASYRPPWRLLFVSFGTGLILLALEVIWFRFLRLYVSSSPIGVRRHARGCAGRRYRTRAELRPARLIIVQRWLHRELVPVLLLLAAVAVLLSYLFFPGESSENPAGRL